MLKNRWIFALLAANFFSFATVQAADELKSDQTLHIDIPVKLEKANVVFDIDHLAMFGDMPYPIAHLGIVEKFFKDGNVQGQIIGLFHSDGGHAVLDDEAYNKYRHVTTGNPYKKVLVDLMKQGVQIELCGITAKVNGWVNANLIPGVKVNTNAMVRLIQLNQEGYTRL